MNIVYHVCQITRLLKNFQLPVGTGAVFQQGAYQVYYMAAAQRINNIVNKIQQFVY